jgi:hypothetical protein
MGISPHFDSLIRDLQAIKNRLYWAEANGRKAIAKTESDRDFIACLTHGQGLRRPYARG